MKLKDMKRSGKDAARYITTLSDDQGQEDYELTVTGPRVLVEKVFAKSDFEISISPKATAKEAEARANELWAKYSATTKEIAPAEDLKSLLKTAPKDATAKSAVVVSLRRIRGDGTFFAIWFPTLLIPRGVSIFFVGPPAIFCRGSVFPLPLVGGDPDLFLTLNGISPPVVSSSTLAGPAIDTVAFMVLPTLLIPPLPVIPFYRILGFSTSLTGFFCWSF
ncbi:MAG: hypothetical protein ND895_15180 [Pyrinomonadaceae bacterium]|nr:hypothetical protein [Pyrinomonadaceae bacterium]